MEPTGEVIRVGMAESAVCRAPGTLITSGLGSCVGVSFYDPVARVGGMAHIMLPDSSQGRFTDNKAKFADTSIPDLLASLEKLGAWQERLVVKMAGGAQMFNFGSKDDRFAIGRRNAEAVKRALDERGIRISGEDVGGTYGRTMILFAESGRVVIKAIDKAEKEI